MRFEKGAFILDDGASINPTYGDSVVYIDGDTKTFVSYKMIVRMYEVLKYDLERKGIDFDEYCEKLFNGE